MMRLSLFLWVCIGAILVLSACGDENDPDISQPYSIPNTYSFDNVDYTNQTRTLAMLLEMKTYMTSANAPGTVLSSDRLKAMYRNETDQAQWVGTYPEGSSLFHQTAPSEQDLFESLIDQLAMASQSGTPGTVGQPGVVVSDDGTKQYLLDGNGIEYAQLIEKGLMGACLYHLAAAVYLSPEKMNVDNQAVEPGTGTAMEHHWDQVFGLLGIPRAFPADTDGLFFWGTYTNRRDPLTNANTRLMNALLKGRAAISNGDLATRDEAISTIRAVWEEVSAATAVHYLNVALSQFEDTAIMAHSLSEALAFVYSLQFNPESRLSTGEIDNLLSLIGGSSNLLAMTIYESTPDQLVQVKTLISQSFGFEHIADQL